MEFKKFSPVTGELIKSYAYALPDQIEQALNQLHRTFANWRNKPWNERQNRLKPVLDRLKKRKILFAEMISNEIGKPFDQSIAEVEKCMTTIAGCLELDLSFLNSFVVKSVYAESEISYQPLGIIYSIMPWNFPLWQAIRMIMPGLLSGNVILLKHSEITPEMGNLIEELFQDLDDGPLLKNLFIEHELTERILSDQRVRGVSLTGSTEAGLKVSAVANKYLKKYVLELGGSDPYLILGDANLVESAKQVSQSRLQNTGQSCIAGKRCLVHESIKDEMIDRLKNEFSTYKFGAPYEPGIKLGPLADVKFKTALIKQLENFKAVTGAQKIYHHGFKGSGQGAFVEAEIYLLTTNHEWMRDQEFFAPVLTVIPFKNDDEAIKIANSTIYGLGAGIFSKDITRAKNMAEKIQAGQVVINDIIKSDLSLPFGGTKMSGIGRELGKNGFIEFTEMKVISKS